MAPNPKADAVRVKFPKLFKFGRPSASSAANLPSDLTASGTSPKLPPVPSPDPPGAAFRPSSATPTTPLKPVSLSPIIPDDSPITKQAFCDRLDALKSQLDRKQPLDGLESLYNLFCDNVAKLDPFLEQIPDIDFHGVKLKQIVKIVLVVATCGSGSAKTVRDNCRLLVERLALLYGRLVSAAASDEVIVGYTRVIAELLKRVDEWGLETSGPWSDIKIHFKSKTIVNDIAAFSERLSQNGIDTIVEAVPVIHNIDATLQRIELRQTGEHGAVGQNKHVPLEDPPPPPPLFGRKEQVQILVQTITATNSHSVISGLGGIGKSSLALTVLHDSAVELHFSRRVFFRCDAITSTADLIHELMRLRKDRLSDGENPTNALREELGVKTTLLLLDNFETIWQADRQAAEDFLQRIASIEPLTVVITTRPGAFVHHLSCQRRFEPFPLRGIDSQSARELFLHVAPGHSHDDYLDDLLTLMDGYPLVIKLVAAVAREEPTIRNVIALWERETIAFADDDSLEDRQRSLRVSLSLSINSPIMSKHPMALDLLALLAQSPVGLYDVPIREAVLSSAKRAVLDTSLAFETRGEMGPRLRLLVPVAEFVRTTLGPPSLSIVDSVVGYYFTELATAIEGQWNGRHFWLAEDMPALFTLISKCLRMQPGPKMLEKLSCGLRFVAMILRNSYVPDRAVTKSFFEEILDFAISQGSETHVLQLSSLYALGVLEEVQEHAEQRFLEAHNLAKSSGDITLEVYCLHSLGLLHIKTEPEASERFYRQAIDLIPSIYEARGQALFLDDVADTFRSLHKLYPFSESCWKRSAALYKDIGDEDQEIRVFMNLGSLYSESTDLHSMAVAEEYYLQAFAISEVIGIWDGFRGPSEVLHLIAKMYAKSLETHSIAAKYYQKIVTLCEKQDDTYKQANALVQLGDLYAPESKLAAEDFYNQAIHLHQIKRNRIGVVGCLFRLGELASSSPGMFSQAKNNFEEALALCEATVDERYPYQGYLWRSYLKYRGKCHLGLGKLYCTSAEYYLNGLRELQEALHIFESIRQARRSDARWGAGKVDECLALIAQVKVQIAVNAGKSKFNN